MYPITGGTMKIMIIEDNDDTAKVESQILTKVGFDTMRVSDGAVAINEMKAYRPNIVVLDLELPGKTGDQIQEEMMQDPELKSVPVIVASVHLSDSGDADNLGNKYMWVHHRYTGTMSKRVVKKLSDGSTIKDLIIEVTATCGETYNVIPVGLKKYWEKSEPTNVPPFQVI